MASPYTAQFETLRSVAHGSITNAFTAVGTPLANPSRILTISNTTDADMLISIDGTNNHSVVAAGAAKVLDLCSNRRNQDLLFVFAKGVQFYVKYVTAPTSGSLYIETIYGEGA